MSQINAAQMKKDMNDGVIICRSSWLALIEYTLKLEAMPQPADCGQVKPKLLTDAQIDAFRKAQEQEYGQFCDAEDMRIFARTIELHCNGGDANA